MRTFYTASDIEDLVASGTRQLEIGPGVVLTGVAKQRAEELGLTLVIPGKAPVSKAAAPAQGGVAPSAGPVRPRGCQHGPLVAAAGARREAAPAAPRVAVTASGGPMVEQLVEAVSALKKRGG
jgi:hypothetical protein